MGDYLSKYEEVHSNMKLALGGRKYGLTGMYSA